MAGQSWRRLDHAKAGIPLRIIKKKAQPIQKIGPMCNKLHLVAKFW